jgi:hypothetical protein
MGLSQFDESIPVTAYGEVVAATALGNRAMVSGYAGRLPFDSITAVNNDVIDHHVRLSTNPNNWNGGDLGVALVPAGAGYTTGPPVNLLAAIQPDAPYLVFDSLDQLQYAVQEVVTSTFHVGLMFRGGTV